MFHKKILHFPLHLFEMKSYFRIYAMYTDELTYIHGKPNLISPQQHSIQLWLIINVDYSRMYFGSKWLITFRWFISLKKSLKWEIILKTCQDSKSHSKILFTTISEKAVCLPLSNGGTASTNFRVIDAV